MVTDLHDAQREKRRREGFHRLDDPPEYSSKIKSWKTQKGCAIKSPEFMPKVFEPNEPSISILDEKCHSNLKEPEIGITLPSTYLHNTKVSTANSSRDNN